MEKGDTVRVKSTGKEGTVEAVGRWGRVLVEFPITLKNGQPGHSHVEHSETNLEVIQPAGVAS